ncbi:MAG: hypothetical protein AB1393_11775 [Candidatus Edwardsbacteria bacterium]
MIRRMSLAILTSAAVLLASNSTFAQEKPEIFVQLGHSGPVTSVAVSPNGRYALSGSWDDTVKLWEIATGREIRTFAGHKGWVNFVAFTQDGKHAISYSEVDHTIKLWDILTGKEIILTNLQTPNEYFEILDTHKFLCLSRDKKHALSYGGLKYAIWNIETGKIVRIFKTEITESSVLPSTATFSSDGKYILIGNFNPTGPSMVVRDTLTGKEIKIFAGHVKNRINSVDISPDGRYAISGSEDKTIKLWDVATGKEIRTFEGHIDEVYSVTFSPNGKYVLSGSSDKTIKLWDVKSGKEIKTFVGHTEFVHSTVFSPDGKYALSGSGDKTLRLWDISTGKEIKVFFGLAVGISSASFSPDGKYLLSSSGDGKVLNLWDISMGKVIKTFNADAGVFESGISPDGKYVFSSIGDNTIRLWDVKTGREVMVFKGRSWNLSPDGRYLLLVDKGDIVYNPIASRVSGKKITSELYNLLKLYDIPSNKEIKTFKTQMDVSSLAFSPDWKYALLGGSSVEHLEGTIELWDIERGEKKELL